MTFAPARFYRFLHISTFLDVATIWLHRPKSETKLMAFGPRGHFAVGAKNVPSSRMLRSKNSPAKMMNDVRFVGKNYGILNSGKMTMAPGETSG